jgi:hypothetical protein
MAIEFRRQPKTYLGLCLKRPTFLSDFKQFWISWTDFHKSHQYKMRRVGASLIHADWRKDVGGDVGRLAWWRFSLLCDRTYKWTSNYETHNLICVISSSILLCVAYLPWWRRKQCPVKRWLSCARHCYNVTFQKTSVVIVTAVITRIFSLSLFVF